jgi:hypothetical protein
MKNFLQKKSSVGVITFVFLAMIIILIPTAGAEGLDVTVKDQSAATGSVLVLPVSIQNAEELSEMNIEISYDPSVLKFSGIELGEISQNGMVEATEVRPGVISVNVVDTSGISRDGEILKLSFGVTGAEGTTSPIGMVSQGIRNLDRNDVPTNMIGGKVTVTGAGLKAPVGGYIPFIGVFLALAIFVANVRKK